MRIFRIPLKILSKSLAHPLVVSTIAAVLNPRSKDFSFGSVQSLLVLKLDEIGDFVLVTPFLRELRRNTPQAYVCLVVKPAVYELAETCPYVNRVLIYDWNALSDGASLLRRQWRALRLAWTELRRRRFDAVLIPRLDADTYHATHLAVYSGSKAILAYTEKSTTTKSTINRGFDRLISHVTVSKMPFGHETEINLALLENHGAVIVSSALELWLTSDDEAFARAAIPDGQRYVAVATGASKEYKRWPEKRYAQLALWLREKYGFVPLLFGAKNDPLLPGERSFLGLSLRKTAALLGRCTLFVGNDSGLKHMAAAIRTPVVEINALRIGQSAVHHISPMRFRAWGIRQQVIQPPPGLNDCAIEEVSLSAVQDAVDRMISEMEPRMS